MLKPRNAVDLDVPAAAPLDPTAKERSVFHLDGPSATALDATVKEGRAAERRVPSAAPVEPTVKDRSRAVDLEATTKDRPSADGHVPPASFEPTIKERSAADRRVPPAASFEPTMKERSTADGPNPSANGWLTWWLTARPHASSSPAAPTIAPVDGTSTRSARPRITRSARTWIVIAALIVASVGGTLAVLSRSTNHDATKRAASGGSR